MSSNRKTTLKLTLGDYVQLVACGQLRTCTVVGIKPSLMEATCKDCIDGVEFVKAFGEVSKVQLREVDPASITEIGPVKITAVGDENLYFIMSDGTPAFSKIL